MSEVKWIKLLTGFFDDEKIKLIESMPETDMILIIWIKLLMLASRYGNYIPKEDIAKIINRPEHIIKKALDIFERFSMVNIHNESIEIKTEGWFKIDGSCYTCCRGNLTLIRQYILERDNYTCMYCGNKKGVFEVDHFIPISKGGEDKEDNLVCSCRKCNRSKYNKLPEIWFKEVNYHQ